MLAVLGEGCTEVSGAAFSVTPRPRLHFPGPAAEGPGSSAHLELS